MTSSITIYPTDIRLHAEFDGRYRVIIEAAVGHGGPDIHAAALWLMGHQGEALKITRPDRLAAFDSPPKTPEVVAPTTTVIDENPLRGSW